MLIFWILFVSVWIGCAIAWPSPTQAELKRGFKRDAMRKAEREAKREYKPGQIVCLQGRRVRLIPTR